MLYQIKDKTGLVIGVHECEPIELKTYLVSLPRQTAPYSAQGLSTDQNTFIKPSISEPSLTALVLILAGLVIETLYMGLHLAGLIA